MNIKFIISSIILVILLFVRVFFNSLLIFFIQFYDQFYFYDLITIFALISLLASIIGIMLQKLWSFYIAIGNGLYDITINLIFPNSSLFGGIFINIIQIGLSVMSYIFLKANKEKFVQNTIPLTFVQISNQYKIHASPELEIQALNHCSNCGIEIFGIYCHVCGTRVN